MTIKEIIDGLKFTMEMFLYNPTDGSTRPVSSLNDMDKTTYDACEGAIELLKQEPCEDCISRSDVLDLLQMKYSGKELYKAIYDLPSVQPQPKSGEWIEDAEIYYKMLNERGLGVDEYTPYFVDDIACSCCLAKYSVIDNETQFFKFCPNCGADMRESEDK